GAARSGVPFSRPDRDGSENLRPVALVGSGDVDVRPAIHPIAVLQAALLLLFVANLGRLSVFSTGEREAPILFNDLCVAALLCVGAVVAVRRRSLQLDGVAIAGLAFALVGGLSALMAVPRFGLTLF